MKYEYEALFKHKGYSPKTWFNAGMYTGDCHHRIFHTLEEAQKAIEDVKHVWPEKPTTVVNTVGMIGVGVEYTQEDCDIFAVSETKIMARQVTEWEEVE